jgi:hypothetical protein
MSSDPAVSPSTGHAADLEATEAVNARRVHQAAADEVAREDGTEEALRILAGGAASELTEGEDGEDHGSRPTFIDYSRLSARLAAANEKAREAREAARRPARKAKSSFKGTLSSLLKRKK